MSNLSELLGTIGRAGLNALYPEEFEYYLLTLELIDSNDKTVDYLSFPVCPDSLTFDSVTLTNIRKTLGGVSVLDVESFVPSSLTIRGTFGRNLKILLEQFNKDSLEKEELSIESGNFEKLTQKGLQVKRAVFNPKLKTGYGVTRVLSSILDKSSTLDLSNKPYKLILYNPAQGTNYQVKVKTFSMAQDAQSSNMMWGYTLVLTCVAPVVYLKDIDKGSALEALGIGTLQKTANSLCNSIRNVT